MLSSIALTAALAPLLSFAHEPWSSTNFTSLVVFGDSYSDDSRLSYFSTNNGTAPPAGWIDPVNYNAADGGRVWGQYVKQYTGMNLYNYAVSGAVCSNNITPRYFADGIDFPAVEQYEVPAFLADSAYTVNGTKFLDVPPKHTVYSMWIGTNDLGNAAFLTDSQVAGTNITTYLDCVYDQLQIIYNHGGRYFVIQNVAPLQLAPLYAVPPYGAGDNRYWPNKSEYNDTEISYRMLEQVATVNAIYDYRTPFAVEIKKRYPGAHFAVMDSYNIFLDIYNNPAKYLNGTPPLNVTGFNQHCDPVTGQCSQRGNPDSYLWFDELHPSEQTERIVARNFVDVIKGVSQYATYWSS